MDAKDILNFISEHCNEIPQADLEKMMGIARERLHTLNNHLDINAFNENIAKQKWTSDEVFTDIQKHFPGYNFNAAALEKDRDTFLSVEKTTIKTLNSDVYMSGLNDATKNDVVINNLGLYQIQIQRFGMSKTLPKNMMGLTGITVTCYDTYDVSNRTKELLTSLLKNYYDMLLDKGVFKKISISYGNTAMAVTEQTIRSFSKMEKHVIPPFSLFALFSKHGFKSYTFYSWEEVDKFVKERREYLQSLTDKIELHCNNLKPEFDKMIQMSEDIKAKFAEFDSDISTPIKRKLESCEQMLMIMLESNPFKKDEHEKQ